MVYDSAKTCDFRGCYRSCGLLVAGIGDWLGFGFIVSRCLVWCLVLL